LVKLKGFFFSRQRVWGNSSTIKDKVLIWQERLSSKKGLLSTCAGSVRFNLLIAVFALLIILKEFYPQMTQIKLLKIMNLNNVFKERSSS